MPNVQAVQIGLALVGLPAAIYAMYKTFGRMPALEEKVKRHAELLDKLPDSAYGREQIEAELKYHSMKFAYYLSFPAATRMSVWAAWGVVLLVATTASLWSIRDHVEFRPTDVLILAVLGSAARIGDSL
ncbi:hypothetical protein MSTE_01749 [Mycobacteroides stephanolepidis]|uniref:Uncharacterized protein n=1 Tax=[Mycobacterium] stephanolepidis TaxID=1520670 RepID=A0A1Z4EVU8_9MYCO|nr:hypothetical protein [[Mycobacterium] stephanolepidis]BAX97067.1 hypothetical protein MSTE_01749 [[Mycobacterium] stephanolepidis]